MRIDYDLSAEALPGYMHQLFRTSDASRAARRRNDVFILAATTVIAVAAAFVLPLPVAAAVWIGGLAGGWSLQRAFELLGLRFHIRALQREGTRSGILGPHTLVLEPTHLLERTPVNESRYAWGGVYKIERGPEFLLLWVNPSMAFGVPLGAFASPAEADAFEARARELQAAAATAA